MARKSKAITNVVMMRKALRARAEASVDRLGSGGEGVYISTKGKKFSYQDAELDDPFPGVIIEYVPENRWFGRPYDPNADEIFPPACFAVSMDSPDDLAPHKDAPAKVSATCGECPYNEFGSADNEKGKKCGNYWRVALVHADDLGGSIAIARISPSGFNQFKKYVRKLKNQYDMHPMGFVTNFTFDEASEQPIINVNLERELKDSEIGQVFGRQEEAEKMLVNHGYNIENWEPPKKGASKKKAGKKKRTRAG